MPGYTIEAAEAEKKVAKEKSEELAAGAGGVGGDVRDVSIRRFQRSFQTHKKVFGPVPMS
jgi:hypothetical protein